MARRARRPAAARLPEIVNDKEPEKNREDVSQRLLPDVIGKRIEAPLRKDDKITLKPTNPQSLSDSENEEPFTGRSFYKSAFVSKSNINSLTSLSWSINSKIERSQSCNDTLNERCTRGRKATQLPKSKVSPGSCPASGILGILLSTENSRSFSAPVLTSEKRLAVTCLSSFTPLHKPERSISPDSNDSISEELNHFKPIVCSPCTPPKRLPDGRVLSPVIIKSTPRNLRKSLQKPTTYEASPLILKKWEQVFQERQMKKTSSKGTLTSSVDGNCPTVNNPVPSSKEFTGSKIELHVTDDDGCRNTESLASNTEILLKNSSVKIPDLPGGGCLSSPSSTKDLLKRDTNLNVGTKDIVTVPLTTNIKAVAKCKCIETISVKPMLKQPCKYNSQTINIQNGKCFTAAEHISPVFSLRRGQKRLCKTKHLEPNGSFKRLKVTCSESCSQNFELLWREAEKRQQEEEDKKLALKLQQMFDKETRTVNRCKGSRDEYPLRSKSTASAN